MTTKLRAASFQDGAVTTAKIAASAITNAKIADGAVDSDAIGSSAIPANKLNIGQIGGRRNIVINGGMQLAQRATSSTSTGYCSLDRFPIYPNNMDNLAYTWAQDSTVPAGEGFSKSAKLSVTTAESALAADEILRVLNRIEGQDMQQASWGTSGAKPLTLSFYVRSNVTGTYAVEFRMNAGGNNSLSKNYTISASNTWERKTITFPANTSTNFNNDTTNACELGWYLAAGTNFTSGSLASDYGANATNTRAAGQTANVASSNSNTWYITGIQMEVGSQATPFEHRSLGDEQNLCWRYYYKTNQGNHMLKTTSTGSSGDYYWYYYLPIPMRASPTCTVDGGSDNYNHTASPSIMVRGSLNMANINYSKTGTASNAYFTMDGITADAEL